jgi:hypothetical protein
MTKLPTDQLMSEMMFWIFADDSLAAQMENFATTYCPYFDYIPDRFDFEAAENKLIYTNLYNQFQGLFEEQVGTWLASKGWTLDEFLAACQSEIENQKATGEAGNEQIAELYEMIVSLTDYSIFKIMMLDQRKKLQEQGQAAA